KLTLREGLPVNRKTSELLTQAETRLL
ncbi:MAG: hypothetical protein QOF56_1386, partial [Acidobacteriaceae bacterium]|nr:hypothetical protein [Acidobacteriaceae bacterium]